jgi:hypothetical protein
MQRREKEVIKEGGRETERLAMKSRDHMVNHKKCVCIKGAGGK